MADSSHFFANISFYQDRRPQIPSFRYRLSQRCVQACWCPTCHFDQDLRAAFILGVAGNRLKIHQTLLTSNVKRVRTALLTALVSLLIEILIVTGINQDMLDTLLSRSYEEKLCPKPVTSRSKVLQKACLMRKIVNCCTEKPKFCLLQVLFCKSLCH